MTMQRKRGMEMKVWKTRKRIDARGNEVKYADPANPYIVKGAFIPQRSAKGEVPGQLIINVARIIIDADIPEIELWSRVEVNGKMWDFVTPPQLHYGVKRHTRHYSIDIRERKDGHV